MSKYLQNSVSAIANPPQTEPLNERQVQNSAGGYSFALDCWGRLDRFLILGSEGGSYYASEKKLTKENLGAVIECCTADGIRLVSRIVEISESGRAPKNDPALLALAYACAKGELQTRQAAFKALPNVARIGTHLFHFVEFARMFRGWGRGLKGAIGMWYESQPIEKLASQVTKYQSRDGWSHADLLRLSHPDLVHGKDAIARWVLKLDQNPRELKDKSGKIVRSYPDTETGVLPALIEGHERIQKCTEPKEAASLIREYGLVRENVPTELLKSPEVWDALLDAMPITALIRNLGNLSKNGVLKPLGSRVSEACTKLTDLGSLKHGRVHPLQVLMAARTYASGHGLRGSGEWQVVPQIVDALDEAYYLAFETFEGTGKRFYLGLDISGSMWSGEVAGIPGFSPAVASGAMAMVTIQKEPAFYAAGFTSKSGRYSQYDTCMTPLALSKKLRLDAVVSAMHSLSSRMGGTDCALPMLDALDKRLEVDVFCVYTDNETYTGSVHPTRALEMYRQKTGIPAKLVVVGMVSNGFSIADPKDSGMLDVVGFDSSTPSIISDFAGH